LNNDKIIISKLANNITDLAKLIEHTNMSIIKFVDPNHSRVSAFDYVRLFYNKE